MNAGARPASLLFCPARGMVTPTFRLSLPFSIKFFWKCPHKHAQRRVSIVILNPINLTVEINCYRHLHAKAQFWIIFMKIVLLFEVPYLY